ncbi:ROK family protein [Thalassorhabdomicrobium marinisediminis]|uniref:N-acetylglucosamine kinase n=1 Tax=Thalassorhabdomicrobium marinisediminis TaxID=2170577 RepID=A0A2T7FX56_9RHOB|nr:ROK family protein [Thalassorhabdomicrobium marinisediminis]PVA06755.1 hypothetical protein DC363_09525 [Thalassorhabdomicrobium marinisediminis]
MIAAGIDLGGTKIEAQLFDADWQVMDRKRVETPKEYPALVTAIAELIGWCEGAAGSRLPVGIGAAGLLNPATGKALTANICATGKPLPYDIAEAAGRPVTYINDCRALALSEAVFGAGRDHRTVMSLILGTGIGGGLAVDRTLMTGPTLTGGEYGHCAAPAGLVAEHALPVYRCGCGRMACAETYIAGPGMARMGEALTGTPLTTHQIAARDTADTARVWSVWCDFTADLLRNLILTVDPDIIVLGGGLSTIDGVVEDLTEATLRAQIGDFTIPPIARAQGGDASGARGAGYAAWQEAQHV